MAVDVDALKERYDRFAQGDMEGALDLWSDDFVWEGSDSPDMPGSGRHEGKEAAIEVLQQAVGSWDKFELQMDEFHESGDTVIVLGHAEGTAKQTGTSGKWPFVHVWRMKDGKANEALILADTYELAKTLGLVDS
jgi:ketosteroid isomerase-like protein